ncbi:MAG: O-acetyl-ADP-ribose deacetylase [Candidatus Omnitrophota bacterium]
MQKVGIKIVSSVLELVVGDITKQDTVAIVNAANKRLVPGGGVDGAIHRAAGPALWEECRTLGGCNIGQAKITRAYNLPNKYVIHTVGPVYKGKRDDAIMLKNSYRNSLKLADEQEIKSIAFPALSTGAFGYPLEDAAEVALKTIIEYLNDLTRIELVCMVLHDSKAFNVHKKILEEIKN